jgi:hypothetical protein
VLHPDEHHDGRAGDTRAFCLLHRLHRSCLDSIGMPGQGTAHGDWDLRSFGLAMGHLDDDTAADHARTKRLEMTDALPDQRIERRRRAHALKRDLQGTLQLGTPFQLCPLCLSRDPACTVLCGSGLTLTALASVSGGTPSFPNYRGDT